LLHSGEAGDQTDGSFNGSDDEQYEVPFMVYYDNIDEPSAAEAIVSKKSIEKKKTWRVRRKLFTKEDPIGFHKYLGLFCLINFIGRYRQMYFLDPAAGLGSRGHPWFSMACLVPHALLSLSSLVFHTVPRERVVGKPMIWKEYRVHNIIFGLRSVLTALAASFVIRAGNTPFAGQLAIGFSGVCVLLSNYGADAATEKLRAVEVESTTATMPYWEGCSIETQKRFKGFYACSQFMATLACLVCVLGESHLFNSCVKPRPHNFFFSQICKHRPPAIQPGRLPC
jgi:hypothetical protein